MSAALATIAQEKDPIATLADAISNLTTIAPSKLATMATALFAARVNTSVPAPRINRDSKEFTFAMMVYLGLSYPEACGVAKLHPKSAEAHRRELRADALAYYGFKVQYERIVRDIVEAEIHRETGRPAPATMLTRRSSRR